jgi:Flp pilus assembly protein TadB
MTLQPFPRLLFVLLALIALYYIFSVVVWPVLVFLFKIILFFAVLLLLYLWYAKYRRKKLKS